MNGVKHSPYTTLSIKLIESVMSFAYISDQHFLLNENQVHHSKHKFTAFKGLSVFLLEGTKPNIYSTCILNIDRFKNFRTTFCKNNFLKYVQSFGIFIYKYIFHTICNRVTCLTFLEIVPKLTKQVNVFE